LLSAAAVRARCRMVFDAGCAGQLTHFALHLDRLPSAAGYVAETVRQNYPSLAVPFHARWRHFVIDGVDRWFGIAGKLAMGSAERARVRFELAITSVLLDAGAGAAWAFRDVVSGRSIGRSEGLALASLVGFQDGLFSSQPDEPLRADAGGLSAVTADKLGRVFQVSADNPLIGLEGRAQLMRGVGNAIAVQPALFAGLGRLGGLFDVLQGRAVHGVLAAPEILALVLEALGPIWPGRLSVGGVGLGDTWRHPAVEVAGPTQGLVPFHKLSQWLSYSLIEPLQEAGLTITDIDGLTGLAEYRNGGLFIDLGVIVSRDPALAGRALQPGDEAIVEWRALTVALLDEIGPLVRQDLGRADMPLAAILEGGTWAAGRRIARSLRPADGGPPLNIVSDGSVF
jgi:hypothetical protein